MQDLRVEQPMTRNYNAMSLPLQCSQRCNSQESPKRERPTQSKLKAKYTNRPQAIWVTSPVSTVIKRVTMRINLPNPGRTIPTWKITRCLAYVELEWQDARSVRRNKFGSLWHIYIGLCVFSLATYSQANNNYSCGLKRWGCLSID